MNHIVEEKKHFRLSPSGSKRWMTCPGSIQFVEKLNIEEKPSKYAAEGTVAHEICELSLLNGKEPKEYLGKTIEADGMKFKVTESMVEAVEEYVNYIRDYIHGAIAQADIDIELQVEVRCSLTELGVPGLDGGTSDAVLINHEHQHVEIVDYKHGAGVAVEARDNPQALCYALGVLLNLGIKELDDWTVSITIVQPRAFHPDGGIRTWELSSDDIFEWCESELLPAARATLEPDAPLVPSDSGCRFCKAASQCPKLFERTQEIAMMDFGDPDPQLPEVSSLTSEQKMFIMDHAEMLRAFIVAVEDQVKTEVDHGSTDYEGRFKLVRKTARRKFTEDALDELASPLLDHLEHEDLFEEKPRTMSEIEKRLKKAIGVKHAKEIMDEVTIKPEGGLVIAPQSDKRKAVQPTIVSDFKNLDK